MQRQNKSMAYFGFNSGATEVTTEQQQQGVASQLLDPASTHIRTDVGIFLEAMHTMRSPFEDVVTFIRSGQEPIKSHVLASLKALVKRFDNFSRICIHYNGHGTVSPKDIKLLQGEAGKWCCADNEYITIEEILAIIDDNYRGPRKTTVVVYADCCGAAGAYDRLLHKLHTGALVSSKIGQVVFYASAQYWQRSYAGDRGGNMTEFLTTQRNRDQFTDIKEEAKVKGVQCSLTIHLHKNMIEDDG